MDAGAVPASSSTKVPHLKSGVFSCLEPGGLLPARVKYASGILRVQMVPLRACLHVAEQDKDSLYPPAPPKTDQFRDWSFFYLSTIYENFLACRLLGLLMCRISHTTIQNRSIFLVDRINIKRTYKNGNIRRSTPRQL